MNDPHAACRSAARFPAAAGTCRFNFEFQHFGARLLGVHYFREKHLSGVHHRSRTVERTFWVLCAMADCIRHGIADHTWHSKQVPAGRADGELWKVPPAWPSMVDAHAL